MRSLKLTYNDQLAVNGRLKEATEVKRMLASFIQKLRADH